MKRVNPLVWIIFLIGFYIFIIIYKFDYGVPVVHSKAFTNLVLMAQNSPGPGLNVYIYKYHDGYGGSYHFVVAERNYKDGVSVTQLK